MSQALSLRKLSDIMHGTTSLSAQPVCLLGKAYGLGNTGEKSLDAESLEGLLADFRSRLWLTYRKDFAPLGPLSLTSDVGWGCTIRSGQMLLAEALARIVLKRCWSRQNHALEEAQPVVELFLDQPDAPLSIHRICAAGAAAGIVSGRWVGPWMLCKSLEALFLQLGPQRPMGLHLHVACGSGGGAPELDTCSIRGQMTAVEAPATSAGSGCRQRNGQAPPLQQQQQQRHSQPSASCRSDAAECNAHVSCSGVARSMHNAQGAHQRSNGAGERHAADAPACAEPAAGDAATAGHVNGSRPSQGSGADPLASSSPGAVLAGQHAEAASGAPGHDGGPGCKVPAAPAAPAEERRACGPGCVSKEQDAGPLAGQGSSRASSSDGGSRSGGSGPGGTGPGEAAERADGPPAAAPATAANAVLLLIPLTLGMDKVNPLYIPQLQELLTWPQSVGIVGGRPGASLFICGAQDNAFLYLDPHEAQPSARASGSPDAAPALTTAQLTSYFCDVVRLLPAALLDPSMAIGFLCQRPAELEDLFCRLEALAQQHSAAPLMTLTADGPAGAGAPGLDDDFEEPESGSLAARQQLEEWELV